MAGCFSISFFLGGGPSDVVIGLRYGWSVVIGSDGLEYRKLVEKNESLNVGTDLSRREITMPSE